MRIILKCKRKRTVNMLDALQFMSKERIEYNVCQLIYKIANGICPRLSDNNRTVQYRETRQRGNIYIDKCRSKEEQKIL